VGSPIISVPAVRATLATNLKMCLERLDWSQSELARRSGVSQKQVNNIVRQRNGCGVEALAMLGQALNVHYWRLLMPNLGWPVEDELKIPGTRPSRGVPHFTNYRRLPAYEQAVGLRVMGRHASLVDWLLPTVCADRCTDCDELGMQCVDGQWRVCSHCRGTVWRVTPQQRDWLRATVGRRFPNALI